MMFSRTLTLAALALVATSASALDYVALPGSGDRVFGSSDLGQDQLYLGSGSSAGSITNPVTNGSILTFDLPSDLTLVSTIRETTIMLEDEDTPGVFEEAGEFFDAVFQDSDGFFVFGSRFEAEVEDPYDAGPPPVEGEWAEAEINDFFRSGFAAVSTAVGWTRETSSDLRMVSAALSTASGLGQADADGPVAPDSNVVTMFTDINGEEGNPFSGWFLIATNATGFELGTNAGGVYQAGEEDQEPTFVPFDAWMPTGGTSANFSENFELRCPSPSCSMAVRFCVDWSGWSWPTQ